MTRKVIKSVMGRGKLTRSHNAVSNSWLYALLICTALYSSVSAFQNYSKLIIALMITVFCIFLLRVFLKKTHMLNYKARNYHIRILFSGLIMLVPTILHLIDGEKINSTFILLDVMSVLILLSGEEIASDTTEERIIDFIMPCIVVEFILGVYALLTVNYGISGVSERLLNTNTQYKIWLLLQTWPIGMLGYFFCEKRNNAKAKKLLVISLAEFVEYIILSFAFLKRTLFVEALVLIAVILFGSIKNRGRKTKAILFTTILLMLAAAWLLSGDNAISRLAQMTMDRFEGVTIGSFDRFNEFTNLFKEFGFSFLLFGRGFGSVQSGPGAYNLHMGILNYLFKGGVFLFFTQLGVYWKAIKALLSSKGSKFYAANIVYWFTRLIYEPAWAPIPAIVICSCIIVCFLMQKESKEVAVYDN